MVSQLSGRGLVDWFIGLGWGGGGGGGQGKELEEG